MGKKSQAEERIGESFINNEGCEFVIVEYNKYSDVIVEFQDEHKARVHTGYGACKSGEIKNPYHLSVYGVGCLGLMSDGSRPITKVNGKLTRGYGLWKSIIRRCYNNEAQYTTYKNVTVSNRWLVYANFLEDLPLIDNYDLWLNNPNKMIALDKDIKQQGVENKVYSLETCKFVTNSENVIEANERKDYYYKKTKVICLETKQVFISIKQASDWCHGDISQCLRGRSKTAGGYHWMYLDDYKRKLRMNTDINNSRLAA